MNARQYQRVTELFDHALRMNPPQRTAYLADACRDDHEIQRAVLRMLAQHDAPAFDLDSAALGNGGPLASIAAAAREEPTVPARIGPFMILGVLGEGGMSVVYRAQQDFPRREVALKVLRGGALSSAAMRRFRAEIETLAKLSHPNIAQVYQAGAYDEGSAAGGAGGQPYFAMELVDGLPLTEYAATQGLSVSQRLRLMIDVCRAVQHAHLRGVIHRDLKPGNILVRSPLPLGEGLGMRTVTNVTSDRAHPHPGPPSKGEGAAPKVLDFGIARATDHDVTRATLAAEAGQIIGTLPYMSPEQLSGDSASIDLRSDVYALGVVLFELLAGELPHAISDEMSLPQTAQALAQSEPRRLSEVNRTLRGELEVIVATAMDRDRDRRYQSADAMADDLQAYLEHRPIRARPPGPILRARKWIRRHPTTATTIGVGTAAAIVISSLLALQQSHARRDAADELARLTQEARTDVQAFADDLDPSKQRDVELAEVRNRLYRYNPLDQSLALEKREQELLRAQNDREAALHRIIDALGRVQRLGAPEDDVRRLLARLYLARVREAEAAGDRFARSTYLELVRQNDPAGELAGEMLERFVFSVRSDPPGAEAHLFRMIEQSEVVPDGEPRLVPVAWKEAREEVRGQKSEISQTAEGAHEEKLTSDLRPLTSVFPVPGQFSLRVVDGRDVLDDDDIVLSVAGSPIRDSVLVISAAPEHRLQPLDRLVSIDGREVRGSYDAYPPLPGVNDAAKAQVQHTYVFERAADSGQPPTRVTIAGTNLDSLDIRAGNAAEALGEAGGPVRVWRRGEIVAMNAPPGLTFRITAKPMLLSQQSRLGLTPVDEAPVERGLYLLLLIKDGYEPLRIPIDVEDAGRIVATHASAWKLLPRGSTPKGFVRFCMWGISNPEPMWIMEREVTIREYLEFLNDPDVLARIDASPTPILYPRSGSFLECGRESADAGGARLFTTGPEMRPDDPVLAVSWYDVMEYVRWRNRRAHASGEIADDMTYDLPSHQEWLAAWGCGDKNQYPWGSHYRSHWTCSNYARQHPAPEPVMRFPIDECNTGAFDMAGSVAEWLNAWWIEERDQREIAGGSWGHGGGSNYRDMFMLYGQNGQTATVTNGTVGFRLVLRKAS